MCILVFTFPLLWSCQKVNDKIEQRAKQKFEDTVEWKVATSSGLCRHTHTCIYSAARTTFLIHSHVTHQVFIFVIVKLCPLTWMLAVEVRQQREMRNLRRFKKKWESAKKMSYVIRKEHFSRQRYRSANSSITCRHFCLIFVFFSFPRDSLLYMEDFFSIDGGIIYPRKSFVTLSNVRLDLTWRLKYVNKEFTYGKHVFSTVWVYLSYEPLYFLCKLRILTRGLSSEISKSFSTENKGWQLLKV